jgi:cytochrome c oxidase subunit 2
MRALFAILAAAALAAPAWAGNPVDGQLGLQPAATPVMEQITSFHNMLLVIITAIVALVFALLLFVMVRFSKRANPTPRKFSHNTLVEIIWTGVPVLILIVIAVPSFKLLYFQDTIPEADMTIKAVGNQWYWEYGYPDDGDFSFASIMLSREEAAAAGKPALLGVDTPMVAPADATVRMIVTAGDVIHNWAMPSFGIKMDAIPGRLNENWFRVAEPGVYYGQCSELCGKDHAFMPIEVHIVPQDVYGRWADAMANGDFDGAEQVLAAYETDREGATRLAAAE